LSLRRQDGVGRQFAAACKGYLLSNDSGFEIAWAVLPQFLGLVAE
jgi:hypothetical protein